MPVEGIPEFDDPASVSIDTDQGTIDPYIDPVSGILRNRYGAENWEELKLLEGYVVARTLHSTLARLRGPDTGPYSVADWKQIHASLFGPLYDWAGEFRTVPISRFGEKPCFNACPETLEGECAAALAAAQDDKDFHRNMAHHYAELNFQHPFREGNGRTLKCLFSALCLSKKLFIDWPQIRAEEYQAALRHWNRTADPARLSTVFEHCTVTRNTTSLDLAMKSVVLEALMGSSFFK